MKHWESLIASRMRSCVTICKIKDTIKEAALWVVAITATMFIVCSVMGGIALMIFGAIKWIGG